MLLWLNVICLFSVFFLCDIFVKAIWEKREKSFIIVTFALSFICKQRSYDSDHLMSWVKTLTLSTPALTFVTSSSHMLLVLIPVGSPLSRSAPFLSVSVKASWFYLYSTGNSLVRFEVNLYLVVHSHAVIIKEDWQCCVKGPAGKQCTVLCWIVGYQQYCSCCMPCRFWRIMAVAIVKLYLVLADSPVKAVRLKLSQ